jgi:hypothetical protein
MTMYRITTATGSRSTNETQKSVGILVLRRMDRTGLQTLALLLLLIAMLEGYSAYTVRFQPASFGARQSTSCSKTAAEAHRTPMLQRRRQPPQEEAARQWQALFMTKPADDDSTLSSSEDAGKVPSSSTTGEETAAASASSDDVAAAATANKNNTLSKRQRNDVNQGGIARTILVAIPLMCKFCLVLIIKFMTDLVVFPLLFLYRIARLSKRKLLQMFGRAGSGTTTNNSKENKTRSSSSGLNDVHPNGSGPASSPPS